MSIIEPQQQDERTAPPLRRFFNFLFHGKAGMWTAIFTGVLAVFTVKLFQVAQQNNETSLVTQRAFVNFQGIATFAKVPVGTDKKRISGYNVHYLFTNSGSTPTKDGAYQANIGFRETTPDGSTDFGVMPQGERTQFVFGPRAAVEGNPQFLSLTDLEAVAAGKKHAFIWGWVVYRDIFPNTPVRLTEFCTRIQNPEWSQDDHSDFLAEMKGDIPPCQVHNCYDENCSDYPERVRELR